MPITWVNTTSVLGGLSANMLLAAAYESRATQIAKLFVPIASFAGDTSQTLTDGSFNTTPGSALASSTAVLATPSNIQGVTNQTTNLALNAHVSAKPLIIKVKRDPFSGDITDYGVFNADGSSPGAANPPGNGAIYDPFTGAQRRYVVNRSTGEIYLNNNTAVAGNSLIGANLDGDATAEQLAGAALGITHVVGMVDFKPLEGAALSTAQQSASELSNVIQSLATLIRGIKDSERNMLNTIR